MIFTEFILGPGDNAHAVEALHVIKRKFHEPSPNTLLIFLGVLPDYRDRDGRSELVRRHDQIVEVVRVFASQSRLAVKNVFLEPSLGRFDIIAEVE